MLLSRCCHPALSPASAIALTLRAVGGLSTARIAAAFLVPEATMAQRISRAKRTVSGQRFDSPGDVHAVLRVLYLIFNEGFTQDPDSAAPSTDLAAEAIRLTRQLAAAPEVAGDPEVDGLLALMLLHHARRRARRGARQGARQGAGQAGRHPAGRGVIVRLADQDRSLWDTAMIAEGVTILQAALARDRLGDYQAQAAIAALHDDAASAEETDWSQILEWYGELLAVADSPLARLNRAVAVGHVDGPLAGLAALRDLDPALPRWSAVEGYLLERSGDLAGAGTSYARAAEAATSTAERDHLVRQAARVRAG